MSDMTNTTETIEPTAETEAAPPLETPIEAAPSKPEFTLPLGSQPPLMDNVLLDSRATVAQAKADTRQAVNELLAIMRHTAENLPRQPIMIEVSGVRGTIEFAANHIEISLREV